MLAVAMSEAFATVPGDRIGLVLTGGNVDLATLPFDRRVSPFPIDARFSSESMKPSRSPSSTVWGLPTSCPVR